MKNGWKKFTEIRNEIHTKKWPKSKIDMTEKTRGATVKYKMYGKIEFEKKFETVKEAKGFFWGYVVKTPNITGELIIN